MRISLSFDDLDAELRKARNREAGVALLTILGVSGALVVFMRRVCCGRWVESWPWLNRSVKAI